MAQRSRWVDTDAGGDDAVALGGRSISTTTATTTSTRGPLTASSTWPSTSACTGRRPGCRPGSRSRWPAWPPTPGPRQPSPRWPPATGAPGPGAPHQRRRRGLHPAGPRRCGRGGRSASTPPSPSPRRPCGRPATRSSGCCSHPRSTSTRRWCRPTPTWSCVGNPTNPTGLLHPVDCPGALPARPDPGGRRGLRRRRRPASRRRWPAADLPGLVVLRSLTKTWGLAGLRVGYLLAGRASSPGWPPPSRCGRSTPRPGGTGRLLPSPTGRRADTQARQVAAWRASLAGALGRLPGVTVVPEGRAPFLLLRVRDAARSGPACGTWASRSAGATPSPAWAPTGCASPWPPPSTTTASWTASPRACPAPGRPPPWPPRLPTRLPGRPAG